MKIKIIDDIIDFFRTNENVHLKIFNKEVWEPYSRHTEKKIVLVLQPERKKVFTIKKILFKSKKRVFTFKK